MISKIKEDESDAFILVNCIKRRKGFLNRFHNETFNRSIEYARNTKIHFFTRLWTFGSCVKRKCDKDLSISL